MFCPNCGNEVEQAGKFCVHCGAMHNTSENTIGFDDLSVLHNALIASGEKLGEVSYSDSIAALVD